MSRADIRMFFPLFHAVAQVRPDQAGEFRCAALQRLQEQPGIGQLVLVRRVGQQLHGFVVGGYLPLPGCGQNPCAGRCSVSGKKKRSLKANLVSMR